MNKSSQPREKIQYFIAYQNGCDESKNAAIEKQAEIRLQGDEGVFISKNMLDTLTTSEYDRVIEITLEVDEEKLEADKVEAERVQAEELAKLNRESDQAAEIEKLKADAKKRASETKKKLAEADARVEAAEATAANVGSTDQEQFPPE